MIITVDKADALPLYEQLRRQIIAGLARGELEPGDMLPSVRRLAKDLGLCHAERRRPYRDASRVRRHGCAPRRRFPVAAA